MESSFDICNSKKTKNILITGSSGYIGKNLVKYLCKKKEYKIRTLSRKRLDIFDRKVIQITNKNFNEIYNFSKILRDIDTVIHLAAFSNNSNKNNNIKDIDTINTIFLNKFIKQCITFKIKKFIFISTSKVYGEYNKNSIFDTSSIVNPSNNYSFSKFRGEELVKKNFNNKNIKYLLVRMPMVYAEDNNNNFRMLEKFVKFNLPLPIKNLNNKKSVLHIKNFCDFIDKIILIKKFEINLVNLCDDFDVTTGDFLNYFIKKNNTKNLNIHLPQKFIKFGFKLICRNDIYTKLFLPNQISNSSAKIHFNWKPKYSFKDYIYNN